PSGGGTGAFERNDQPRLSVSCNVKSSWLNKFNVANTTALLLVEHSGPGNPDQVINAVQAMGWKSLTFKTLKPRQTADYATLVSLEATRPDVVMLVGWDGLNWQELKYSTLQGLVSDYKKARGVASDVGYKILTFNMLVSAKDAINFGLAAELYGRDAAEVLG